MPRRIAISGQSRLKPGAKVAAREPAYPHAGAEHPFGGYVDRPYCEGEDNDQATSPSVVVARRGGSTLDRVDWNAELVRGDVGEAVQKLKQEPGKGLLAGGVKLPLALGSRG